MRGTTNNFWKRYNSQQQWMVELCMPRIASTGTSSSATSVLFPKPIAGKQ